MVVKRCLWNQEGFLWDIRVPAAFVDHKLPYVAHPVTKGEARGEGDLIIHHCLVWIAILLFTCFDGEGRCVKGSEGFLLVLQLLLECHQGASLGSGHSGISQQSSVRKRGRSAGPFHFGNAISKGGDGPGISVCKLFGHHHARQLQQGSGGLVVRELYVKVNLVHCALQHLLDGAQECAGFRWMRALVQLDVLQAVIQDGEAVSEGKFVLAFIWYEVEHGAPGLIQAPEGGCVVVGASAEGQNGAVGDNCPVGRRQPSLDVAKQREELLLRGGFVNPVPEGHIGNFKTWDGS